jgi:large subunit ribosomal protein L19
MHMTIAPLVRAVEEEHLKTDRPEITSGDSVRVHVKVVEGTRERIQVFEGIVISLRGEGINRAFTVRRIAHNVGVERTFLIHSPNIDKIEVVRHHLVRRKNLYYMRNLRGKAARLRERREV